MSNAASAGSGSEEVLANSSESSKILSDVNGIPEFDENTELIGMAYTTDGDVGEESGAAATATTTTTSTTNQHSLTTNFLDGRDGAEGNKMENDAVIDAATAAATPPPPLDAPITSAPAAVSTQQTTSPPTAANRVYGLSRDLTTPSADSTFLPSSTNAYQPMGATFQQQQQQQQQRDGLEHATSSSNTLDNLTPTLQQQSSSSSSNLPAMPSMTTHGRPAPASNTTDGRQPDGSSQFSIEVIATSFDKRGYPIFSGRAAQIRGVIRLKAIVGCHVEIKLGAYICQGSPAVVWDGVALMPPESGGDHKLFTVREKIPLSDSMMRTREGISSISAGSDDFIFETPFDFNLPLGMSTRFVNGEPTVSAVALPPSFEVSSESILREKDILRSTNNALKSSAASVRSKSSRLTSFAATTSTVGNSIRDVMEKGFGEVYRIGCFYYMEFTLIRDPQVDNSQKKKLFGKSKAGKPVTLDSITVPFIFLGEQSTEQPPPLSIPATLIANAVARPGSFLGDGWQCERSPAKWPGKIAKNVKRQLDIEMHMPFPATVHAPSLFPVLIILRPQDPKLLSAVPVDFIPISPNAAGTDESQWGKGSSGGGDGGSTSFSMHSRQPSESTQRTHRQKDEKQSHDGGMLSKFMRSSLSLSRKTSNSNMGGEGVGSSIQASQSALSLRNTRDRSVTSDIEGGGIGSTVERPPSIISHGGKSGVGSIREAMSSKFGRRRPNTAPTSRSSSDGRSKVSGSTMLGSGGQYIGNLSGLVRVSLVQTTFCIGAGPSEPPKNIRKLISMAEVEELDPEALRGMVKSTINTRSTDDGNLDQTATTVVEEDEHQILLREALKDQMDNKGVRVLRALFRVGSDPTPSFRCQGIELRYAIKVDLVPFQLRDHYHRQRPSSGGTFGGGMEGSEAGFGGSNEGSVAGSRSVSNSKAGLSSPIRGSATSNGGGSAGGTLSSPILSASKMNNQSPRLPSYRSSTEIPSVAQTISSPTAPSFAAASAITSSPDQGSRRGKHLNESSPRFNSGETVVTTVYADRVEKLDKIEKGVGVLFVNVRMVRGAV